VRAARRELRQPAGAEGAAGRADAAVAQADSDALPGTAGAGGMARREADLALCADRPEGDEPGRWASLRTAARDVVRDPRRSVAVAVLGLLLLTGGGLLYAAQQLKDPGAARNRALTDTGATGRLTGEVSDSLSRIFGYAPDDTRSTELAARDALEGRAAAQYRKLFAQVKEQVATQHLTLSTRVVRAGVVSLTGDRAELLVFLDQTAQRAGAEPTIAAAQLSVSAHLVDGHWRISELKAR
jgi:Mce-associated membrane protein